MRPVTGTDASFPPDQADHLARLVLSSIHREYPNQMAHVLSSEADVAPPRQLTPVFYGCYDWHSAVHGHWSLVRLLRVCPAGAWADDARAALDRSLTPANIAAEVAYLEGPGRAGFERPYGLAWLLQLAAELREGEPGMRDWLRALEPLEETGARHLEQWLPKLGWPIRSGEHSQTAFALGLALDWARTAGRTAFEALVVERSRAFYSGDVDLPVRFEPSGHDFLSPALAEADLLRRVLSRDEFSSWLDHTLPNGFPLSPVASTDSTDGKLAHLDGLNLSRAWMLDGVASALDESDPRKTTLERQAQEHAEAGRASVTGEHYAGGHWLGTFALYLLSRRGLDAPAPPGDAAPDGPR